MFIHVKTSSTEEGMIVHSRSALHKSAARHGSDTGTGADHGRSSQCLCCVSEPSQKRLYEPFIQRSVMPHQRLSKHHLLFEFPEKTNKHCIRSVHIYSQVHKYWDIDTILTFLALYTTTMDFK